MVCNFFCLGSFSQNKNKSGTLTSSESIVGTWELWFGLLNNHRLKVKSRAPSQMSLLNKQSKTIEWLVRLNSLMQHLMFPWKLQWQAAKWNPLLPWISLVWKLLKTFWMIWALTITNRYVLNKWITEALLFWTRECRNIVYFMFKGRNVQI